MTVPLLVSTETDFSYQKAVSKRGTSRIVVILGTGTKTAHGPPGAHAAARLAVERGPPVPPVPGRPIVGVGSETAFGPSLLLLVGEASR